MNRESYPQGKGKKPNQQPQHHQPVKRGLTILELKAMTAMRIAQQQGNASAGSSGFDGSNSTISTSPSFSYMAMNHNHSTVPPRDVSLPQPIIIGAPLSPPFVDSISHSPSTSSSLSSSPATSLSTLGSYPNSSASIPVSYSNFQNSTSISSTSSSYASVEMQIPHSLQQHHHQASLHHLEAQHILESNGNSVGNVTGISNSGSSSLYQQQLLHQQQLMFQQQQQLQLLQHQQQQQPRRRDRRSNNRRNHPSHNHDVKGIAGIIGIGLENQHALTSQHLQNDLLQPPTSLSPMPTSADGNPLSVQELKELTRMRLLRESDPFMSSTSSVISNLASLNTSNFSLESTETSLESDTYSSSSFQFSQSGTSTPDTDSHSLVDEAEIYLSGMQINSANYNDIRNMHRPLSASSISSSGSSLMSKPPFLSFNDNSQSQIGQGYMKGTTGVAMLSHGMHNSFNESNIRPASVPVDTTMNSLGLPPRGISSLMPPPGVSPLNSQVINQVSTSLVSSLLSSGPFQDNSASSLFPNEKELISQLNASASASAGTLRRQALSNLSTTSSHSNSNPSYGQGFLLSANGNGGSSGSTSISSSGSVPDLQFNLVPQTNRSRTSSNSSIDSTPSSPKSLRHKSKLSISIACPSPVRARSMSDSNSIAFEMAESILSTPSTPSSPASHKFFPTAQHVERRGSGDSDTYGRSIRRMNSNDSVKSLCSNGSDSTTSLSTASGNNNNNNISSGHTNLGTNLPSSNSRWFNR